MTKLARLYGLDDKSCTSPQKNDSALQARVALLEAELKALRAEVREIREARPVSVSGYVSRETKRQFQSQSQSHGDEPWIAAGVSKATWYRRKRAEKSDG